MMKRSLGLALTALALAYGCSSSSGTTTTPTTDGGGEGGGGDGGGSDPTKANLAGQIVDYSSQSPVPGVTVAAGSVTGTTDTKGTYALQVAKDSPFSMLFTIDDHFPLWDQEMKISADVRRGKLRYVDKTIGNFLLGTIGADPAKGIVSTALLALPSCLKKAEDFPQGATFAVEDQPATKVCYYKGTPQCQTDAGGGLSEAQAGEDPSGIIINAEPDKPLKVKVTYSKCTQKAFPVAYEDPNGEGTITYTGNLSPKGNTTLSVYRIFFE